MHFFCVRYIYTHATGLRSVRHHYVESLHFTTSKGSPLHHAVAVVQTPHREYYILRGNGMQIGCEEDGVADVWQVVLGCDTLGTPGKVLESL